MFSTRCFSRVVRFEGGQDPQAKKALRCRDINAVFQAFFVSLKATASVASGDQESEKHRLENTVGNFLAGSEKKVINQKRPDVHEIALSIKVRSPPPRPKKKCRF